MKRRHLLAPVCLGAMMTLACVSPESVHADTDFNLDVQSNDSLFQLKNSLGFSWNHERAVLANGEEALLKRNQAEEAVLEKKNSDAEAAMKADNAAQLKKLQKEDAVELAEFKERQKEELAAAQKKHDEEVAGLKEKIAELDRDDPDYQTELDDLNAHIARADAELAALTDSQEEELVQREQELAEKEKKLQADLDAKLQALIEQNRKNLADLVARHRAALDALKAANRKKLADMAARYRTMYQQACLNLQRWLLVHPANAPHQLTYRHETKIPVMRIGNSTVTWPAPQKEVRGSAFPRKGAAGSGKKAASGGSHEVAPKKSVTVSEGKKQEDKSAGLPLGETLAIAMAAVAAVVGSTLVWRSGSNGDGDV